MQFKSGFAIFLFLMMTTANAFAQVVVVEPILGKDAKVTTLRNDPLLAPNLLFAITPVFVDANNNNLAFGYGADASYLYNNSINFFARYLGAYLDRIDEYEAGDAPGTASTGTSPMRLWDFGASVYIIKDTSPRPASVLMKAKVYDNTVLKFYLEGNVKKLRAYGLRAGFMAHKTYVQDENSRILFKGYVLDDPEKKVVEMRGAYSTMMESNILYAGFSHLNVNDILVDIEGVGLRSIEHRYEVYTDILYAPQIVYYNMSARTNQNFPGYREYNVNANTAKNRFGLRAGITYTSLKKWGIFYGLEAGVRPGLPNGLLFNTYFNLRAGLNFATRI